MPDDQRFGDADRDPVEVGSDLVVDPKHGVVLVGADDETNGDDGAVVLRLAVDVLDTGDRLDDGLQRLRHQLRGIGGLQTVGGHHDVDHRHTDLRLLLPRDGEQRDEAGSEGGEEEKWRERGADRPACQPPGEAEVHGRTSTSPSLTPDRISRPSGMSGPGCGTPRCTGASTTVLLGPRRLTKSSPKRVCTKSSGTT